MVPNTEKYRPLYRELLENALGDEKGRLFPFFCQVGKDYFKNESRILFVGKSANGWVTDSRNVDILFTQSNENRIVNRTDQMEWVDALEGPNPVYNTRKSAFWRVVKGISSRLLNPGNWYGEIAWTNLFKVSPIEGNPRAILRRKQLEICRRIFDLDLINLSPRIVIFLTSGWEIDFLSTDGYEIDRRAFVQWADYKTYYSHFNNRVIIHSPHPQGKPENQHIEAICKILVKEIR